MKSILFITISILLFRTESFPVSNQDSNFGWKAGVAKVVITPESNIWMAGFASRTKPAQGTLHDLWAKALFLEDSLGNSALLITTDLLGFPKVISDRIRNGLKNELNLSYSQIILNSSHTHSGPVLTDALSNIYSLDEEQEVKIENYSNLLVEQIIELAKKAKRSIQPANIYAQNGVVRFQVNRRNNSEPKILELKKLKGPNDFAVPVLKVENKRGRLKAIVFGYSCHPTVLTEYKWSGDYPGFAQLVLEDKYKGATAMFFQGAGGDQNPLPRRTIPLAKQYGNELAAAVVRVLNEDMRKLAPNLKTVYSEVDLKLSLPPVKNELTKMEDEFTGYMKNLATDMLDKMERGELFITSYPYPVQLWKLGDQIITSLGGELLINYSISIKKIWGEDTFIMGYSNDVMAYIPSEKVLKEGGYEGETSQMVYGMPSKWDPGIEDKIIGELIKLANTAEVLQNKKKIPTK